MPHQSPLKKIILAVALAFLTTTTSCSVKAVFSGGYMDPLIEVIGVLAHTKLALPAARLIQLRTLPEPSE